MTDYSDDYDDNAPWDGQTDGYVDPDDDYPDDEDFDCGWDGESVCLDIGEGWYALGNIANDDMPGIDFTYPSELPDYEKTEFGLYLTDYIKAKYFGKRYPRA